VNGLVLETDVVIVGGGCAGLWLLDELRRRGVRAILLEANRLGQGQTAAAQGILHGGLKYSLSGIFSRSAQMVRDMPGVWQASLDGREEPDLSAVRLRSQHCHLWRGPSWKSWTAMLGAVTALAVKPVALADDATPDVLAHCPRPVYQLDERVIDPCDFSRVMLARNQGLVWKIDGERALRFDRVDEGRDIELTVRSAEMGTDCQVRARHVVLTAGAGNAALGEAFGLPAHSMQRRPLRIGLVRGDLPVVNGHCIDGATTRVTITSDVDSAGRMVWTLGGQVAEVGAGMSPEDFLLHAKAELTAALPGWQTTPVEWTSYAVDRAERSTNDGTLPGDVQIVRAGQALVAWPTKLVLAPRLAQQVVAQLALPPATDWQNWRGALDELRWPAPLFAVAPWEQELPWSNDL